MHFLRYKIIGAAKKFKTGHVPYLCLEQIIYVIKSQVHLMRESLLIWLIKTAPPQFPSFIDTSSGRVLQGEARPCLAWRGLWCWSVLAWGRPSRPGRSPPLHYKVYRSALTWHKWNYVRRKLVSMSSYFCKKNIMFYTKIFISKMFPWTVPEAHTVVDL